MYVLHILVLLLGGILASASLIIAKKPSAEELIKKIAPYQSWIGLVLLIWGLWGAISFLLHLRWMMSAMRIMPIFMIAFIVAIIVEILLGLVLAMNFMKSRKELPKEKLEAIEKKLKPIQVPLGLVAVADAVLLILAYMVRF